MEEKIINKKHKWPLIITTIIGVLSIAIGVTIYLTLYLNTKNYKLLKNNVDIYKRLEEESVEKSDYVYSLTNDALYFEESTNGCKIDITKAKENNANYLMNDYYIELQFSVDVIDTLATNQYAEIKINSNVGGQDFVIRTVANRINSETLYFDDQVSYFNIQSVGVENAEMFKISDVAFKFYSYVR